MDLWESDHFTVIRLVINGKSSVHTFVSLDNALFLFNESPAFKQSVAFTLARQAASAIVDTVIGSV